MYKIFINFRNGDEAMTASFMYETLVQRLREDTVFRSSDSIPPGADYALALESAARECEVMLSLIGPDWLKVTDSRGRRRLDDERDWVRREIAAALAAGRTVIPVLVAEAGKVDPSDLPPEIRELAGLQYMRLRPRERENDMRTILAELRKRLPGLPGSLSDDFDIVGMVNAKYVERGGKICVVEIVGGNKSAFGKADVERVSGELRAVVYRATAEDAEQ